MDPGVYFLHPQAAALPGALRVYEPGFNTDKYGTHIHV